MEADKPVCAGSDVLDKDLNLVVLLLRVELLHGEGGRRGGGWRAVGPLHCVGVPFVTSGACGGKGHLGGRPQLGPAVLCCQKYSKQKDVQKHT